MSTEVPSPQRPPAAAAPSTFLDDMVIQACSGSGLLVAAAGLGLRVVLAKMCLRSADRREGLVLLLNATEECLAFVEDWMLARGARPDELPLRIGTGTKPEAREQAYRLNRVCAVDLQYAAFDILQNRLDASLLKGVIVWNAHAVASEDSPAAFALRLLRERAGGGGDVPAAAAAAASTPPRAAAESAPASPGAAAAAAFWVRGLTEAPAACVRGGGLKLRQLLGNLTVPRVWLWPRFHIKVDACLRASLLEVVELQASMPRSVAALQKTLTSIIDQVVRELKSHLEARLPAGSGAAAAALCAHGALSGALHGYLRSELGISVEKLAKEERTLLKETDTLCWLLRRLHRTTAIDFYEEAEAVCLEAEGCRTSGDGSLVMPAHWMHASAARLLLPQARARVFNKKGDADVEKEAKFATLAAVLDEVKGDWAATATAVATPEVTFAGTDRPVALILVRDRRTQYVVSQLLRHGEAAVTQWGLRRYIRERRDDARTHAAELAAAELRSSKKPAAASASDADAAAAAAAAAVADAEASDDEEECLFPYLDRSALAAAAEASSAEAIPDGALDVTQEDRRHFLQHSIGSAEGPTPLLSALDGMCRGSGSGGANSPLSVDRSPPPAAGEKEEDAATESESETEAEAGDGDGDGKRGHRPPPPPPMSAKRQKAAAASQAQQAAAEKEVLAGEVDAFFGVYGAGSGPCVVVHPHANSAGLLHTLKPSWVVMYDPSVELIRMLEVYAACHPVWRTRVYVLGHTDSVEQQGSLTNLSSEVRAFQALAQERARLPDVAVEAGTAAAVLSSPQRARQALGAKRSSRAGGGGLLQTLRGRGRVLVDLREYKSRVPSALHRCGLAQVPVHMETADYVLAPDVGVERKSVPDLLGSLASGRLVEQVCVCVCVQVRSFSLSYLLHSRYPQLERLTKRYAVPVLLIEFDGRAPFSLQDAVESIRPMQVTPPTPPHPLTPNRVPQDDARYRPGQASGQGAWGITTTSRTVDITDQCLGKIAAVAGLFPTLRVWWSRDVTMTARLFEEAKAGREQPDPDTAARDGVDHAASAFALLRSLPGVTQAGAGLVAARYESLAELADASQEALVALLGEAGSVLHGFLHTR